MVKDSRIRAHFKKNDPLLFSIISAKPLTLRSVRSSSQYFVSLCRIIVGQQLSTKVADVIFSRFKKLFYSSRINPDAVLAFSDDVFRGIGMSGAKTRFIKDVAQKVKKGEVNLSLLSDLPDVEVMTALMRIKGVGPWTAEMYCIFTLGREDVFSCGDLGLKRAIQKLYHLKKEPSLKTIERISKPWKPYRTYASLALWSYLDAPVVI